MLSELEIQAVAVILRRPGQILTISQRRECCLKMLFHAQTLPTHQLKRFSLQDMLILMESLKPDEMVARIRYSKF